MTTRSTATARSPWMSGRKPDGATRAEACSSGPRTALVTPPSVRAVPEVVARRRAYRERVGVASVASRTSGGRHAGEQRWGVDPLRGDRRGPTRGAPARVPRLGSDVVIPGGGARRGGVWRYRPRPARLRRLGQARRGRRLPHPVAGRRRGRGPRRRRGRARPRGRTRLGRGARLGARGLPARAGRSPGRAVGGTPRHLPRRSLRPDREVLVHAPLPVRGRGRAVAVRRRLGELPGLGAPPRRRRRRRGDVGQRVTHPRAQLVPGERRARELREPPGRLPADRCADDGRVEHRRHGPHRGTDAALGVVGDGTLALRARGRARPLDDPRGPAGGQLAPDPLPAGVRSAPPAPRARAPGYGARTLAAPAPRW